MVEASTYHVEIKSTAPAVIGARINFTAELYQDGKIAPRRQYNFRWSDSAFPKHTQVSRLLSYVYYSFIDVLVSGILSAAVVH